MAGASDAGREPRLDELNLEAIADLIALCRRQNVVRISPTELVLGPPPPQAGAKNGESQDARARKDHYETMLGMPVSKEMLEHLP